MEIYTGIDLVIWLRIVIFVFEFQPYLSLERSAKNLTGIQDDELAFREIEIFKFH